MSQISDLAIQRTESWPDSVVLLLQ